MLRVFERLLADPGFRTRRSAHEVLHFAAGVVRNLLARLVDAHAPSPGGTAARAALGDMLIMPSGPPCGAACSIIVCHASVMQSAMRLNLSSHTAFCE